ncbi:MAG: hypothetical protein C4527_06345 [Candidatus Omnitrophota bacterium]|nr:MAG: hypothetical protein C4527_06345 [Candidatus Omnitrophota bacterium]
MKKRFGIWCVIVGLLAAPAISQDLTIKPVFELLAKNGVPGFPFMKAQVGLNDFSLGDSDYDMISSFVRYDANRLLLYVVENGIDENDPNHDAAMAAQFPDRTIWWISPNDGSPMGIALQVGLTPWPHSDYYIQKTTGQHPDGPTTNRSWALTDIYPVMSVDGDGYLYVGNVHNIIRYTLNGNTFGNPQKVWNRPEVETANLHYRAWRIWDMNVTGSGQNKKMTIDAKYWIDLGGTWYLTSNDGGASWTWEDEFNSGGGASIPVVNQAAGEEWVFNTAFPGRNGGQDFTPLRRYIRPAGSSEEFQEDPAELWAPTRDPAIAGMADPDLVTSLYQGWAKCDVAAYQGIPYIVVCTLPRWQSHSADWGTQDPPTAWLAIHSSAADPNDDFIEGDFVSAYQIQHIEADELGMIDAGVPTDPWHNIYLSEVNIYVPAGFPSGAFEILWSGGAIGYGRYVVGDVVVNVNEWSIF